MTSLSLFNLEVRDVSFLKHQRQLVHLQLHVVEASRAFMMSFAETSQSFHRLADLDLRCRGNVHDYCQVLSEACWQVPSLTTLRLAWPVALVNRGGDWPYLPKIVAPKLTAVHLRLTANQTSLDALTELVSRFAKLRSIGIIMRSSSTHAGVSFLNFDLLSRLVQKAHLHLLEELDTFLMCDDFAIVASALHDCHLPQLRRLRFTACCGLQVRHIIARHPMLEQVHARGVDVDFKAPVIVCDAKAALLTHMVVSSLRDANSLFWRARYPNAKHLELTAVHLLSLDSVFGACPSLLHVEMDFVNVQQVPHLQSCAVSAFFDTSGSATCAIVSPRISTTQNLINWLLGRRRLRTPRKGARTRASISSSALAAFRNARQRGPGLTRSRLGAFA